MCGQAALLLWNDYAGDDEPAFNEWYNRRHIPERVPGLPGFLRARRFEALGESPKYIALYELASAAALRSEPYRALLANLDPETRHFTGKFGRASKTSMEVWASDSYGEGRVLCAIAFDADPALLPKGTCNNRLRRLLDREGIAGAHLLRRDETAMAGAKPTRPDDLALPWVLLVEATTAQPIADLHADDALGLPAGTARILRSGLFQLIFASTPLAQT